MHEDLLKKLETEHRLEMMRQKPEDDKLRAWMVEKYGEEAVIGFEDGVKDGDGIDCCLRKLRNTQQ